MLEKRGLHDRRDRVRPCRVIVYGKSSDHIIDRLVTTARLYVYGRIVHDSTLLSLLSDYLSIIIIDEVTAHSADKVIEKERSVVCYEGR